MKTILLSLALICSTFAADEYRNWTQSSTSKKIEAKMLDKSPDGVKVQLCTRDGKAYWMPISSLVEDDQKLIIAWQKKPLGFDALTVRVVGKPETGKKTISCVAKTWEKPATLTVYFSKSSERTATVQEVQPYGTVTWSGKVNNEYRVTLVDSDGTMISDQTAMRKD
jgi:hypothetical protein